MLAMPKKGLYGFLVALSCFCGVIWGVFSIGPYRKMKEAIADGNTNEAWVNARKVRTFAIIGVVINTLFILYKIAQ